MKTGVRAGLLEVASVSTAVLFCVPLCVGEAPCAANAQLAARAIVGAASVTAAAGGAGFRAVGLRHDRTTSRLWVDVEQCGHLSAPHVLVAVALPFIEAREQTGARSGVMEAASGQPIVRPGDFVSVSWNAANVRMELQGRAEQNGRVGEQIRVHIRRAGIESSERTWNALVRDAKHVEVVE